MELNSYPDRLDLNDVHLRQAKQQGVKIVINTDCPPHFAHGKDSLRHPAGPPRLAHQRRRAQHAASAEVRESHEARLVNRGAPHPAASNLLPTVLSRL